MKLRNSNLRTGSNKAWLPVAVALALTATACDRDRSRVESVAGTTVPGETNAADVTDTTRSDADFDSSVSGTSTAAGSETGMATGTTASKVSSEASGLNNESTAYGHDAKAMKKKSAKRMKKSSKAHKGTTSGVTTGDDTTDDTMDTEMGSGSGMTIDGDETDTRDIYDRSHTPQPGEGEGIGESRDSSAIESYDGSTTESAMTRDSSEDSSMMSEDSSMMGEDRDVVSGTTTGEIGRDTTDEMERDTAYTDDSMIEEDSESISSTTTSDSDTPRTTDSMMDEDSDEMTETMSGTTSDSMDSHDQMMGERSKDKSSEQILSQFNPASIAISPYTYEPYSRMPAHVGSVQITGKDKSVAVLERMSRFTDPNALVRNTNSKMATRPLTELNISDYDFDRRGAFQSDMHARLLNLDQRMEIIRAQVIGSTTEREQMLTNLSRLAGQHNALERRVDYADAVNSSQWLNWRSSFRSELAELESQIAQIGVALR